MNFVILAGGLVILVMAANILVTGSVSIAKRYNISNMVIGLTIVSFGTSLPELIVNVNSSLQGASSIALGNVLGSNISNILLILGITAAIYKIPLKQSTILSEIPFSLIAALLIGFLANAKLFDKYDKLLISRYDGLILLFFFALFLTYIFQVSRNTPAEVEDDYQSIPMKKSILYICLGMFGLWAGGELTISGAVNLAKAWGMSEGLIGLTIMAIGTSLPELVTSASAAFQKKTDIAVGNVIGSNIFNILWILGITSVISPIQFNIISNFDVLSVIFASTLILLFVIISHKKELNRVHGIIFLLCYGAYTYYVILRG